MVKAAVRAVKQLYIKVAFKNIDLLDNRGRRNIKLVGGFGKAAAFGNGNKCFKLRVVQNKSLLLNALAAHVVAAECALFVKFNFMVQAVQCFLHMLQTAFKPVALGNQKVFALF